MMWPLLWPHFINVMSMPCYQCEVQQAPYPVCSSYFKPGTRVYFLGPVKHLKAVITWQHMHTVTVLVHCSTKLFITWLETDRICTFGPVCTLKVNMHLVIGKNFEQYERKYCIKIQFYTVIDITIKCGAISVRIMHDKYQWFYHLMLFLVITDLNAFPVS